MSALARARAANAAAWGDMSLEQALAIPVGTTANRGAQAATQPN
jgi:hypothetical protein